MTEEYKMPQYDNTHRLTLSEVKDCGYARLCRRSMLNVLILAIVFAAFIGFDYFLLRYDDNPRAKFVFYLLIGFVPIVIYSIINDFVGLRRLYASYESFELVTCEIWNASSLEYGWQAQFRNDRRAVTHNLTFTTADGVEHKLASQKVKKGALIYLFRLDRYNGSAQFLYDAQKDVLYPFTPLPPKVKKR